MAQNTERSLFVSDALFNCLAGFPFIVAMRTVAGLMGLQINATAAMFIQITAAMIVVFGGVYCAEAPAVASRGGRPLFAKSLRFKPSDPGCGRWSTLGAPSHGAIGPKWVFSYRLELASVRGAGPERQELSR